MKVAGTVGILSGSAENALAQQSNEKQNELLVGVAPTANARQTAQQALPSEARIIDENDTLGYVRAELPDRSSASATASVASTVASRRGVEYAERNAVYETLAVPNDPRFGDQYAPEMVNAPAAWETTLGESDVIVAVVDQGIKYDHPDLEANVADGYGHDFVDNDDDPYPDTLSDEQHGTHVAGIVAAGTDNNTGVAGISNATLLSVRTLDKSETGYTADIADGIQWAADNGADIINLSLGGGFTETLQKAVSYAHEKGVLLVAAAGNDGGSVDYPAAYDECIAVSALDPDDSLASYSSRGPEIELAAPGTNLLSTWTDNGYATLSGTSMAAPVVSGIAALALSQAKLSNTELHERLKNTATSTVLSNKEQGAGKVDAKSALSGEYSNTISIVANDSYSSYTITVSGDIGTSSGIGGIDSISGPTATGAVGGSGTDMYGFSGIVTDLEVDGDASVYIDGDRVAMGHEHTLTVAAEGSYSSYDFSTIGEVEPRYGTGGSDSVSGSSASGALSGSGTDSYGFSGSITSLTVDGTASVYLDGEKLDASHEHTLVVEANGSYSSYEFSVSGGITSRQGLGGVDRISGSSASGALSGNGRDVYGFSGELQSLDVDGNASITVDGKSVETNRDVVTITSTGGRYSYRLSTSEALEKSTAMGASIDDNDDLSGTTARGQGGGGGLDSYSFAGEVTELYLDGNVQLYRNGTKVAMQKFLPETLTVEATGPYAQYEFSTSGGIATAEGTGGVDSVDVEAGRATGAISGDGRDNYAFAGELHDLSIDGDVDVYVNGELLDTGLGHTLAIDGSGSYSSYDFSVTDRIGVQQGIGGKDTISGSSATGAVGGDGKDIYGFSGTITDLTVDGDADVYLDDQPIDTGLEHTLVFEANNSYSSYEFSTTGHADSRQGIGGKDRVSGSSASGAVGGSGCDAYGFSGTLRNLDVDGNANVYLDDDLIDLSLPASGIHNGLSDANFDTIDRMAEWQNTNYAVQNLFVPWNPDEGHMNWLFERTLPKIWNAGRTPLITWEPYTPGARTASVDTQSLVERNEYDAYIESLADTTPNDIEIRIGNGDYDRYIDRWAGRLRNALSESGDRQAYLRLAHEMNGDWYPWSPAVGNSNPRSYGRMWRHVHNRFDRQGIGDDLQWMWCVNAEDVTSYRAEQMYPGNRYVDWLGLDGYNWGRSKSWSSWDSPNSIYGGMLDRLSNLSNKPICVAEFASSSRVSVGHDPRRKGQWIRDALEYFENHGVDMWCWFNEDKETDWAVFNGVRGTERVKHNGRRVNAYSAYGEAIDTYTTISGSATAEASATEQAVSDD
ncbi:serine protease halolysin R4 [Halococcus morrhuae DSM 1307]|uniref:Serine protease halolysin R4 n=1 Tax=Halococcus morrhuae DSM 1307 TaxID=931277 RepID=M0M4U5_HALMO|nr:serine protease halolysin R4 [Halococcus morrhuae DSM 1307]